RYEGVPDWAAGRKNKEIYSSRDEGDKDDDDDDNEDDEDNKDDDDGDYNEDEGEDSNDCGGNGGDKASGKRPASDIIVERPSKRIV
ncbi:14874_t:CDS:1, partial [Dentiscutata erythropus]